MLSIKIKNKILLILLSESIYDQFRQRCEEQEFSMFEAGYCLIIEELEEVLYNMYTNEIAATTKIYIS